MAVRKRGPSLIPAALDIAGQDLLDVVPDRDPTGLSAFFRETQGILGAVVLIQITERRCPFLGTGHEIRVLPHSR
jgi:hypothetical protein